MIVFFFTAPLDAHVNRLVHTKLKNQNDKRKVGVQTL